MSRSGFQRRRQFGQQDPIDRHPFFFQGQVQLRVNQTQTGNQSDRVALSVSPIFGSLAFALDFD